MNVTTNPSTSIKSEPTTSIAATKSSNNSAQFLTLLTAQLKQQDPLNPMDSAQLTQQMSQLNMLSQLESMNSKLDAMSEASKMSQMQNATQLLHKNALVSMDNKIVLEKGQSHLVFEDPNNNIFSVVIKNEAGTPIRKFVNTQNQVQWDGLDLGGQKQPNGVYAVDYLDQSGRSISGVSSWSVMEIQSIKMDPNGPLFGFSYMPDAAWSSIQSII